MKILWVTSFNQILYDLSGKKLVDSFIKTNSCGDLLVCHEKMRYQVPTERIIAHELSTYPFLTEWLNRNADIIPEVYGGKASFSKEVFKNYWNVKASLWFRKIASLHMALTLYGKKYDAIIWIDSDCVVTKTIPESLVVSAFGKSSCFYHLGEDRENGSIESGLIGFLKGSKVLHRVFKMYQEGTFRKEIRWDDGYIFRVVLKKKPSMGRDVVNQKSDAKMKLDFRNTKSKDVIHRGPFREFVVHNKGQHKSQSKQYCPPKPIKTVVSNKEVRKKMGK